MPTNNQNLPKDNLIIEITSSINAALYSAISNAIGKAPAPIKAGLFLHGQLGGILQVGIATGTDNQGRETAEFIGSLIGGVLGVLGGGGVGSVRLGIIGSAIGQKAGEAIYDYFTDSVQATQASPQIAINHDPTIKSVINALQHQIAQNNQIAQFTFDTNDQALSNWQDTNILNLNDQGQWEVNTPDITFDDTGDILDFEDAMFQELQDGWITQAEFDAVQNYVLGYSLGDDGSNANFNPNDYNFDPIGAFYDSQSATFDNAQSIASNQPSQTSPTSEPTTPDSNYRTLRDTDNIYEYPSNGVVSIANQLYNQNQTLKAA
ncbi:hypothetical protein [uncultured Gammaproteobacteria bacterium]|jgi:hypothetical protein|nr:hypothetical protein [uncultured Gammaproteobacteria bacterium]CAC9573604.1 hypothetical protein [uncultured Gammaproteobacteria bacterium]